MIARPQSFDERITMTDIAVAPVEESVTDATETTAAPKKRLSKLERLQKELAEAQAKAQEKQNAKRGSIQEKLDAAKARRERLDAYIASLESQLAPIGTTTSAPQIVATDAEASSL